MKRFGWIVAFLPSVFDVEGSLLRGSVIPELSSTSRREDNCPDDCRQLHGQRSACHACPRCQWYQRAQECEEFQFHPVDHAHHTAHLTTTKASSPLTAASDNDHFCGCADCTRDVWDRDAHGFSCGFRIRYYTTGHGGNHTMEQACARVASRYDSCQPCMPYSLSWTTASTRHANHHPSVLETGS